MHLSLWQAECPAVIIKPSNTSLHKLYNCIFPFTVRYWKISECVSFKCKLFSIIVSLNKTDTPIYSPCKQQDVNSIWNHQGRIPATFFQAVVHSLSFCYYLLIKKKKSCDNYYIKWAVIHQWNLHKQKA